MFKKLSYLSLTLAFLSAPSYSLRDGQDYLNDNAHYPSKVMAIGEGDAYGNYDASVYKVDIAIEALPDLVDDITTQRELVKILPDSFDKILLCNIQTPVFNSDAENGVQSPTDDRPLIIFKGLHRLLKPGGTLEFNNMWGADIVSNEEKLAYIPYLSSGKKNPFNQYLTMEDLQSMQGKLLTEIPVFQDYTQQLQSFFSNAGFRTVEFIEPNPGEQPLARPISASTYKTPRGWWKVTK